MQWSDIPFHPKTNELRQFAGLWLLFFGGMAVWQYVARGHGGAAAILAVLAIVVGSLGLIWPRLVRPVYVGWMVLAFPIGWTVSRVTLAILFFGIFTPIAIWFRLIGRDPLERRRRTDLESYWMPKPAPGDVRNYYRQF